MAIRWIYADESGIHEGAPHCVVVGYMGSPLQWERFSREWNAVLKKYGVESFHANEFFNRGIIPDPRHNPYLDWSEEQAANYLDDLLSIIKRRQIAPVGVAVDVKDFESLSYGEQCVLVGYQPKKVKRLHRMKPAPYHLAVRGLIESAITRSSADPNLHFVLSEQRELQGRAIDAYNLLKKYYGELGGLREKAASKRLKGIGVESPLDFPGLQAADFLANRWYYYLTHKNQKQFPVELQKSMNVLTSRGRALPLWDYEFMDGMFRRTSRSEEDRNKLRAIPRPF